MGKTQKMQMMKNKKWEKKKRNKTKIRKEKPWKI